MKSGVTNNRSLDELGKKSSISLIISTLIKESLVLSTAVTDRPILLLHNYCTILLINTIIPSLLITLGVEFSFSSTPEQ